jgi:N-acylglucosamine-6-phosphate 2-epimerase
LSFKSNLISRLTETVLVSVQASKGEPLYSTDIIVALCESVLSGGACGLRLAHVDHIRAIKRRHPHSPVVGLTKPEVLPECPEAEVYITPTLQDALTLLEAGADVIAMDATLRTRPQAETLAEIVRGLRERSSNVLLWADCDTLESAQHAEQLGFDLLSTTLSGYTSQTAHTSNALPKDTPDFELLKAMCETCSCPVFLEGRVWLPEHVAQAKQLGAAGVVIGSAITRPHLLTQRFVAALS